MKSKLLVLLLAMALAIVGFSACYSYMGHRYYLNTPSFAPTNPGHVQLLRHEPKRQHIQLGEVWIRPEPGMSSHFVENSLRERASAMGADALVIVEDRYFNRYVGRYSYWHGHRAYRERDIVGVAIRYR
ncbi:MAG TPA: hypothetical protein VGB72_03970 [Acidobacteriota bacterium]